MALPRTHLPLVVLDLFTHVLHLGLFFPRKPDLQVALGPWQTNGLSRFRARCFARCFQGGVASGRHRRLDRKEMQSQGTRE